MMSAAHHPPGGLDHPFAHIGRQMRSQAILA